MLKLHESRCVCRLGNDGLRAGSPAKVDIMSNTNQHETSSYLPQQLLATIHTKKSQD